MSENAHSLRVEKFVIRGVHAVPQFRLTQPIPMPVFTEHLLCTHRLANPFNPQRALCDADEYPSFRWDNWDRQRSKMVSLAC